MSETTVAVQEPSSPTKFLRTRQRTVGGNSVQEEAVFLVDENGNILGGGIAPVSIGPTAASFLGTQSPVVVVSAQNTTNLPVRVSTGGGIINAGQVGMVSANATQITSGVAGGLNVLVLKNIGANTVFLGDSTVTASGSTIGYPFASTDQPIVMVYLGPNIYGICATGQTSTIAFMRQF